MEAYMSDNINISNPVKVISDSAARVAFELMKESLFTKHDKKKKKIPANTG